MLGWRALPVDPDKADIGPTARAVMPSFRQLFVAGAEQRRHRPDRHRPGAAHVLPAQAGRARHRCVLPQPVPADHRLQGHADRAAGRGVLPGPGRRAGDQRAGRGALPVLHQHLPGVAAGPPVPLRRAQRRDQHVARQPELDGRPRGAAGVRRHPGRPGPADPDRHPGRQRLGHLRRGAGAAAPGRAQPAARGADDDPGGLGEPRGDGPAAAGLLRVPLHPDGAVGRPGPGRVHRRHPDRRRAGPQRPAPGPLVGHRGRHRGAGLRGRRAGRATRPRWCARAGWSRARCSWSTPRPGGWWTTPRSRGRWPPSCPTPTGCTPG